MNDLLKLSYGIDFNSVQKGYTIVTDDAAVMAKLANSSVSTQVVVRDHKWMGCHVHVLQNRMKAAFEKNQTTVF